MCVTVNTDDPTLFGQTLSEELVWLNTDMGMDEAEVVEIVKNGFRSAALSQQERERLLAYRHVYRAAMESDQEFDEMLARVEETPEVDGLLRAFLDLYG